MNMFTMLLIPIILMISNLFLLRSFKNKLMYKDDGNWFYQAIFYKHGLRTYKLFEGQMYLPIIGIYTLSGTASFFYNLLGKNKYTFFNKFKMTLMSLMSLSIYYTIFIVTGNLILSILADVLFNLLYHIPKRAFYITYAENYQSMPVIFAFVFFKIAILINQPELLILSGMVITFSLNWKVTGIIHLVFFPLIFIYSNYMDLFFYYFIGLILMNLVFPLFILGFKRYRIYLMIFIRSLVYYPSIFLPEKIKKKLNVIIVKNIDQKIKIDERIRNDFKENPPISEGGYVEQRKKKNIYNSNTRKTRVLEFFNDYRIMIIISIATIIYGLIQFNGDIYGLFILTIASVFMWYVQSGRTNNYYNLILPFIYIFFILGLNFFISSNLFGIIFSLVILNLWIIRYWQPFYAEMKNLDSSIPTFPKKHTLYAKAAKDIGEYIKLRTKPNERIFVWGNMPVVYLFAERLCTDFKFLFTYPIGVGIIHDYIKVLLIHLKRNPPKYITFFQYVDIVDEWDMEKIQNEIKIPYKLEKIYPIKDDQKEYHPIPLYVRDDRVYLEMLYERFRISKKVKYLEKILSLSCKNKIAKFWKIVIKEQLSYEETINYFDNYSFTKLELILLKIDVMKYFGEYESLFEYLPTIEVNEKNCRIFQEKGEFYFARGQINEAFKMFKKANELNLYSAELYNDFGVLSYSLEDFQSAIFYLKKAIDIFPEYEDAKNNLNSIMQKKLT